MIKEKGRDGVNGMKVGAPYFPSAAEIRFARKPPLTDRTKKRNM